MGWIIFWSLFSFNAGVVGTLVFVSKVGKRQAKAGVAKIETMLRNAQAAMEEE